MGIFKPGGGIQIACDQETQRVFEARQKFSLAYMEKMGWGTAPGDLTIEQIMEIRGQPEWKDP